LALRNSTCHAPDVRGVIEQMLELIKINQRAFKFVERDLLYSERREMLPTSLGMQRPQYGHGS